MATNGLGIKGAFCRQTGTALLFRAFLQQPSGAFLPVNSTVTMRLDEFQQDGTIRSYDWSTNTFKSSYCLSTSSVTIGTGSKTFTVPANAGFTPADNIQVISTANGSNFFTGTVTSYSGTTLVVNVTAVGGSGTFASWKIIAVLGTTTVNMVHQYHSDGIDSGMWTYALTTLTGFTVGCIYSLRLNNINLTPTDQDFLFQYGSAEGDLIVYQNGTGISYLLTDVEWWAGQQIYNTLAGGIYWPQVATRYLDDGVVPKIVQLDANHLLKVDVEDIRGTASAGAAGYIGPDWSHVNAPTSTVGLSGTTIGIISSYTGNTPQTGDSFLIVNNGTYGNVALEKLLRADLYIDETVTPWALVYMVEGSGGIGVGTELMRKKIKDTSGVNLTSTTQIPGSEYT